MISKADVKLESIVFTVGPNIQTVPEDQRMTLRSVVQYRTQVDRFVLRCREPAKVKAWLSGEQVIEPVPLVHWSWDGDDETHDLSLPLSYPFLVEAAEIICVVLDSGVSQDVQLLAEAFGWCRSMSDDFGVPLVFYEGPARVRDLNFQSRVFGKSAFGDPYDVPRALILGSPSHFRDASHAWFTGQRKTSDR